MWVILAAWGLMSGIGLPTGAVVVKKRLAG
jgi:hypothetical protein